MKFLFILKWKHAQYLLEDSLTTLLKIKLHQGIGFLIFVFGMPNVSRFYTIFNKLNTNMQSVYVTQSSILGLF